jgi:hypothetical protein
MKVLSEQFCNFVVVCTFQQLSQKLAPRTMKEAKLATKVRFEFRKKVARFFLVQPTKTRKNLPNYHNDQTYAK